MLTAAIRDLHLAYPNRYLTDVRTPCPALWEANSLISPIEDGDPEAMVISCEYPLIHQSNQLPFHFIHGFHRFLAEKLDLRLEPTEFSGFLPISAVEKSWISQVHEIIDADIPFWIVVAGGKFDFTIKWWDSKRFQQVIDHFLGKLLFVQVGENDHCHPDLRNVLNLRGKTDLRQLIRLVYHSQGVLCPVTVLMHLAAAIETKSGMPRNRPCVVVAGGREPPHWEAYPHHQFIHTVGALRCCEQGGCWRSRTLPLGDGDEKDRSEHCCLDVVGTLPRCMDMITVEDVVRRIELYFAGGGINYLSPEQASLVPCW